MRAKSHSRIVIENLIVIMIVALVAFHDYRRSRKQERMLASHNETCGLYQQ